MKRIVLSTCIMLGLALSASAQDRDQRNHHQGHRSAQHAATTRAVAHANGRHFNNRSAAQRNVATRSFRQNAVHRQERSRAVVRANNARVHSLRAANERHVNRGNRVRTRAEVAANTGSNRVAGQRAFARQQNRVRRERNATVVNHWRGERFNTTNYVAFHNYHREWHDRGWWRSHYNRIIFVGPGWGWWAWSGGYWYPAWGFQVGFNYPYYGPIYGYSDLTPSQIVVNVQAQLQRDGYDPGPVDGVLGPMTRRAIADFQVDHGLVITSTIDRPTLVTLGLV
jgi:Putative peptidoglycan binding domain